MITLALSCLCLGAWLLVAALACGAYAQRCGYVRRRMWGSVADLCLGGAAWAGISTLVAIAMWLLLRGAS